MHQIKAKSLIRHVLNFLLHSFATVSVQISVVFRAVCVIFFFSGPTLVPPPTPPGWQQKISRRTRGTREGTRDLGCNPVCLQGHRRYRAEAVGYCLQVDWRNKQQSNCHSPLESCQCLPLNAGEETGCRKMIIEKKVGGPLWPRGPRGRPR